MTTRPVSAPGETRECRRRQTGLGARPLRRLSRGGILAALAAAACGGDTGTSDGPLPFPAPTPLAAPTTTADDFVGAEACADCHRAEYTAWSASTHGRAGGAPGPDVVVAPFDGRALRFADATVTPRVREGAYEFVVRQDGFEETVFGVDGVIGGGHMIGGGTQGFVARRPDGTLRFLPWDWSRTGATWFCNTDSRANRGWQPITPEMRLADCGDWPPQRVVGTLDRFANCQECHGSQIRVSLQPGEGYRTEYTTLQINCESCHGPARRHVERARAGDLGREADIGIRSLANLDKDASLAVCFQCHALKDVIREGYLPGETLDAYYALKFPSLGDEPYQPDGRVRTFAYQEGHLASACYLRGPMDCVSCHEPHGQGYWDADRRPLSGPFDDGQCTSCHASKAAAPQAHSFHAEGPDAPGCVSCHMPYLQHADVGAAVAFARSDHTISVPRPVFDDDLGIVGACRACHEDRSPLDLQTEARRRWGETTPHRAPVEGIAGEFRARNLEEAAALLLAPGEGDGLLRFQALGRLVGGYLRPDADVPAPVLERLRTLAQDADLDVRALALAALHWTSGDAPEVRRDLADALSTTDQDQALRGRWMLALGFIGDRARDGGDFAAGRTAYLKALELRPGDARVLHSLGQLHNREGAFAAATDVLRRSVAADPVQPLAWINLGIALAGTGDVPGATQAYEEALRLNPYEALAHLNLGNIHQRAARLDEARAAYERAVAADPALGLAHFELARSYIRLERVAEALPHARRAVEFMPAHEPSRQMLADLERALGGG